MFRRRRIPPPLQPSIPQAEEPEYDIELPYGIADQPRIFLHFLATNTKIDADGKELIQEWLSKYDAFLTEYIYDTYGFWGYITANQISAHVHEQFMSAAKTAVDGAEKEFFERLEEEMGDE